MTALKLAGAVVAMTLLGGCATAGGPSPLPEEWTVAAIELQPTETSSPTSVPNVSDPGIWATKSDIPTPRYALTTSVFDGKIYAIGGTPNADGPSLSVVEVYDPASDSWMQAADMPTPRLALASGVVNGIIYAIGGTPEESNSGDVLATVEAYDPQSNSWARAHDMPTARLGLCVAVVDGILYAIGGLPTQTSLTSTVEAYDPTTDSWSTKAELPTQLGFHSCAVLDGRIYAVGGGARYGSTGASLHVYDPDEDAWTTLNELPGRNAFLSASAIGGNLYAIGGQVNPLGLPLSIVWVYDPIEDAWAIDTEMPTARHFHASSAVNGKIYVIGGRIRHSSLEEGFGFATVEEFSPGQ